jgi:hypothetical protein
VRGSARHSIVARAKSPFEDAIVTDPGLLSEFGPFRSSIQIVVEPRGRFEELRRYLGSQHLPGHRGHDGSQLKHERNQQIVDRDDAS